ncbi:hypothetical protein DH2020_005736 [Rehmannia glutinosa]|uniref:GRF-type domain-containing protein n=1 Tax=Rehmannia glutinosa TaxID=99300 RepID=A0ABR0XGX3_REHGL
MEGLWSDHFPAAEKTPPKISPCKMNSQWSEIFPAAEKPAEPAPAPYQRCLICPTCNASCRLLTSKTDQNPDRKFYKCPAFDHKFFKWADEVKPDEFIDVPYCGGCMAGVCRVRKEKSGPNAGRVLFMCRVKEGEGSCGYRVWQDELQTSAIGRADENITSSQSPTVNNYYTRPANTYLVKENGKSNGRADNESPVINTSEHLHCPGVTSRKMDQVKCQENQRNEFSRRAHGISDERITSFQSPTVNGDHTEPANTDLVKENKQINGRADNESHVINTSEHLQCLGVTSWKTDQVKCPENQRNEFSRRAHGISDERITSFQSPMVNGDHTEPANAVLVEENKQRNEMADNESPMIDTSQHLQCLGGTSKKIQQLKCQENQRSESSRRAHRISDERITSFQSPTVNRDFSEPANTDLVEENNQRKEQPDNESPVIDTSQHLRMEQLKCQENQPIESLRRPHKRSRYGDFKGDEPTLSYLVKYISSPLNSTFVVQDNILVNSRDSATLTTSLLGVESYRKPLYNPGHVAELSGTKTFRAALDVSSCSDPFTETSIQNAMSKSISNAFSLAAEHLQNDFLALLEKTDVKDHETMSRAAEATFAALDRLLFDNQDFKTRAEEYIHCATSLAEIERSMPGNESYQKLVDRCSSERTRLDEINSVHAKAVDSMTNNKKRLKVLQEEISSTMDWLFQIEAELSCCEVEMRNMENELDQISKNKGVLEEKYLTAANELEKLKKLCEQREAEREAAKAAFERARELLRG